MNPKKLIAASTVAAAAAFPFMLPVAHAQQQADPQGVEVDKPSRFRNLVPAEQIEAESVRQYSEMMAQAQQKGLLAPQSSPQLQKLKSIAKQLIPQITRWNERAKDWNWEVNLIKADSINAFAMPGGKIAFFSGIIDRLNLTDDEIAIVMAHEMAHALREHARERVAKSGLTSAGARIAGIGLSAILGIDPNLTTAAAGGVANLAMLRFSRSDETDADLVGLDMAARAGFDPRAGVALWKKMAAINKSGPPQWLSTHPAGSQRITEMTKHMPNVLPLYAKQKGTTVAKLPPYRSS